MNLTDRNTFPRNAVALSNNYRIMPCVAATPGADTNSYTLLDTLTNPEFTNRANPAVMKDFGRYVLILKNSGSGTLQAYGSLDGINYSQYFEQAVTASAAGSSNSIVIPVEPHRAVRIVWVNGGSAQSTWYVAQALDGERLTSVTTSGGGGGGGNVVVTSGQLTANQGTPNSNANRWPVQVTDGTNVMPTADAPARAQYVRNTDGTNTAAVKAASTAAVAADPALVVALSPNNLQQGVVAATSTVTNALDVLPLGRYNAIAPTLTDGQLVVGQSDVNGNSKIREQYAPLAEDNTNGVIAVMALPLAVSTYCYSTTFSTTLATNLVIKSTAGVIRSISGRIDGAAATGTFYIHLWNLAALPGNATAVSAGNSLMAPYKIQHTTGTDSRFQFDFTSCGIWGSAGLVLGLSTTEFTQTAGTAHLSASSCFK